MESSLFAFAIDLVDGGIEAVLDETRDRCAAGSLSLAVAYHHARDIFPRNPKRKVYYHEGGTVFFRPETERYGAIVPQPSSLVEDTDVLADLCRAVDARSMQARAWTVYLHNTRLSMAHPDHAPQNAFGDRYLTDLCPSDPVVAEYAVALTSDICRYPVRSIMAEALHHRTIDHGYHHERSFVELGPTARFLLGLCFCESCSENGRVAGVDPAGLAQRVAGFLAGVFERGSGGHDPLSRESLAVEVGDEITGYLAARSAAVSRLVEAVAATARDAGVEFTFSAHGGSAKAGSTRSTDSPHDAWVLGVDLPQLAAAIDTFQILGYVSDATDLERLAAGYLDAIGAAPWAVGLRPMWPDSTSPDNVAEKVAVARRMGAHRVDFYHYGLMPSRSLDWIGAALAA